MRALAACYAIPASLLAPLVNLRAAGELLSVLSRHRQLTWEMTKRELTERHAGQMIGSLWAIGHPMVVMAVYVFLFSFVFRGRVSSRGLAVPLDFTVYILSGLIPWLIFQDAINRATVAISGNASLVKQVVFPIEILPTRTVLAVTITETLYVVLLATYVLLRFGTLPTSFMLVPLLMFTQMAAMAGICFAVSAAGSYLRDLQEVVAVFGLVNIYLMPVVYLPDWVPQFVRPIMYLNPFSYMTWCYQDAIYFGRFEHPWAWVVFPLLSFGCFAWGYRLFRKLKTYFGNVL